MKLQRNYKINRANWYVSFSNNIYLMGIINKPQILYNLNASYTYDYSNGYIIANLNSLNNYVNLIGHLSFSISY
jgi:hypothetical protein